MKFTYAAGERPLEGYTVKVGLGCGGFGEVYHAVSDGGKEVALKLVQRYPDIELRGVRQCLNLKHPNLVTLFDVRDGDDGELWIVMEYVNGVRLNQVIDCHPNGMPPEAAIKLLRGMCAGLGYLHEQKVVHRDLKPANLFVENDTVKIGDYGLSKLISASRRSGQTQSIGSVHYMAPEIGGGRYGNEIDLYAVGVILYEMLTGRVPFDGETPAEILMKHMTMEPDLAIVPVRYRPVVARLLKKDPQQRYPSVRALMTDVEGPRQEGPHGQAGEPLSTTAPYSPPRQYSAGEVQPTSPAVRPDDRTHVEQELDPVDTLRAQHRIARALGIALIVGIVIFTFGAFVYYGTVGQTVWDDDAPLRLVVFGLGFLGAGLTMYLLCRGSRFPDVWGLFVALLLGAAAGLMTAALAEKLASDQRGEYVAAYCGTGSGFISAGLIMYLTGRRSQRHPIAWSTLLVLFLGTGACLTTIGIFSKRDELVGVGLLTGIVVCALAGWLLNLELRLRELGNHDSDLPGSQGGSVKEESANNPAGR